MNKLTKFALAASILIGGIASTQACSLGAWDSNGSAVAGGPADAINTFARYQGLCSMQVTAVNGSVTNNGLTAVSGPAGEASMIARFYFLESANSGQIFETYSDDLATLPVYTVSFDVNTRLVTITPAGGSAVTALVNASTAVKWHSVEIKWANAGGVVEMWVDTDSAAAADATTASVGAATIQAAVLGGTAGMIFDAYESRRTTKIGRLVVGDANDDKNPLLNVFDLLAVKLEILNTAISTGTPDCNESGAGATGRVDVFDLLCVKLKVLNGGM